jgi:hypothetical protein
MKKWRNFISLFFAICAFLTAQALTAEAGAWKTPPGRAQAAEKNHSAGVKGEMASRAVMELANGVSMRLLQDLVEKMLGIYRSSELTVTLDTERIVASFLVEF